MNTKLRILAGVLLFPLAAMAVTIVRQDVAGLHLGTSATQPIGFHGATPVAQRTSSAQAAVALTFASGTLTLSVQPTANDTAALGSKTYTFKSTLTGAANEVLIGASASTALANLIGASAAATTGGQAAGTTYGTGTTANTAATLVLATSTTATATAIAPGTAGNSVASTTSFTSGSNHFGAAALAGATDPNSTTVSVLVNELRAALVAKGLIKGS